MPRPHWRRSASCAPPKGTRWSGAWPTWWRGSVGATIPAARARRDLPSSPIIPVILGTEQRALEASAALLAEGLWVPAIRPPTVPAGTSRLRVTVSAAHTDDQVRQLVDALAPLRAAMLARAR